MKRTIMIFLILAIAFGLLFLMASTAKAPEKGAKKKATPRPSITINPYAFPLPQMDHGVNPLGRSRALICR